MTPLQVIESIYEAFGRGDIAYIVSAVAPGAPWRQSKSLPWGGDYSGPEGAVEFFTRLAETMDTLVFRVDQSIAAGDEVFSFGYYEGRSIDTGRTGSGEWMFRWKVSGNKVVSYVSYYLDTASLLAALPEAVAAAR